MRRRAPAPQWAGADRAVAAEADSTAERIAELHAIVQAVQDRVRAGYAQSSGRALRVADLMPIVHAGDAAQAKIAAIGSVNPRAGGPINNAIQLVKRGIARALGWFVRDQITFNQQTVAAIEAVLEALNDHNRVIAGLLDQLQPEVRELKD